MFYLEKSKWTQMWWCQNGQKITLLEWFMIIMAIQIVFKWGFWGFTFSVFSNFRGIWSKWLIQQMKNQSLLQMAFLTTSFSSIYKVGSTKYVCNWNVSRFQKDNIKNKMMVSLVKMQYQWNDLNTWKFSFLCLILKVLN